MGNCSYDDPLAHGCSDQEEHRMSRQRAAPEPLPPCYAMVLSGLEPVAGDEIARDLGGEVKRTAPELVVFRVPQIDASLLRLRTTEDVFLFGWGTDKLTYRAEDLERIRRWTAREADWDLLLRLHHQIRPKPKGRPTFRLVTQMTGTHGYRRVDAREALAKGLVGKLPASWRHAEENAAVEIWLTIHGATAVCGLRLSDRTMRHRNYKIEHLPASLRPTVAAAMVRLAEIKPNHVVLDPLCGAGTLLAEAWQGSRGQGAGRIQLWGGDIEAAAVRAAGANLRRFNPSLLARWDATRLPLPEQCVDHVLSNPPFGKQLSRPEEVGPLYRRVVQELDRVLRPNGRSVLLVSDLRTLKEAAASVGWKLLRSLRLRILGQRAMLTVWRKP
jgi:23S rRNA G2445 N2-methylase RlmL